MKHKNILLESACMYNSQKGENSIKKQTPKSFIFKKYIYFKKKVRKPNSLKLTNILIKLPDFDQTRVKHKKK